MSLQDNIAARKLAESARDFVVEIWQEHEFTPDGDALFWKHLHDLIGETAGIKLPEPVTVGVPPMNTEESRKFGRVPIPFGKHQNKVIDNVPLDYLLWLDAQPDFRVKLSRYLASRRIQHEQYEAS